MKGRKREEEVKAKRETEERKEGKGSNVEAQGKTKKGGTKGEEGGISEPREASKEPIAVKKRSNNSLCTQSTWPFVISCAVVWKMYRTKLGKFKKTTLSR